jgi:hypothetical protein
MNKDIVEAWFRRAMNMKTGQRIFIELQNKAEVTATKNDFIEIKRALELVSPIEASKVDIMSMVLDNVRLGVCLVKKGISPVVGFLIEDDNISKVTLTEDFKRARQLELMVLDGYSLEQIVDVLGELTEEEMTRFNLKKDV